jgi:N-acetylmuramoyl-L-alanine amidase
MNEMSPLRIFPLRSAALQKAPVDKTVRYWFINADSQLIKYIFAMFLCSKRLGFNFYLNYIKHVFMKRTISAHLLLSCLLFFSTGCSRNTYSIAHKVYKQELDTFIKTIKNTTPLQLTDAAGNKIATSFVPTVNFNLRRPQYVIIHHTEQDSLAQTLKTFTNAATQVSAHYVIGRDGQVVQMLNDYLRAWHAGISRWGNDNDINSASIGIELDNNGTAPFSEAQMKSLVALLSVLKKNYSIPTAHFIGHADVAPSRKVDPSALFDWKRLSASGFGLWYDAGALSAPPAGFDPSAALRAIGYDTSNLAAAIMAFKLHFIQSDLTPELTDHDKEVLWNLSGKY